MWQSKGVVFDGFILMAVYPWLKVRSRLPLFRLIPIADNMAGKAGGELSRLVPTSITIHCFAIVFLVHILIK